jgi:hypothetical protein
MEDDNELKYTQMILSIIDYKFIRRTNKDLQNISNKQIKHMFLMGKDDIIVSQIHAKLIVQNDLFDYDFYNSHYYYELSNMTPNSVLNHYLIYGKNRKDIVSHTHAQQLTQSDSFNIDLYKSMHVDLSYMSPRQLVYHYIMFGKRECRTINN